MAVRMAVGARRSKVLTLFLSHGLRLAALGLLVGVFGSLLIGQVLRSFVAEVRSLDVATLGGVVMALLLASVAASLGPAIRAGNTPPADALREEA
jgi:putative ABC transport system permease protein